MTNPDSLTRGFYANSPGQDLAGIVERLTESDFRLVLGEDLISFIHAISQPDNCIENLNEIAKRVLHDRADDLMARTEIQQMCLRSMSREKRKELVQRLDLPHIEALQTAELTRDAAMWQTYLGFFGIDARGTAPFTRALDQEGVQPRFDLFLHQRRVAQRVCTEIRGGHGRVVLHMPTGAGKTRTAMHIVSRVFVSSEPSVVVWLAASRELLDQAAEAFQHAWPHLGNRRIEIVRFWGDYAPDLSECSDCFIIAGLQKMHALMRRDDLGFMRLAKSTNLVIVDEAHQSIAPSYQDVINTLSEIGPNSALVGLTATPGRTWSDIEIDKQLSDFFDGRKVTIEVEGWRHPVSFLISEGYLAKPIFHHISIEINADLKRRMDHLSKAYDYDPLLLNALSVDLNRNVIILNEIRRLIESGHRRIIFFAASVRHAELVSAALTVSKIDGRVVTGNTRMSTRSQIIKSYRRNTTKPMVLCNFGVLTTGFDAPNTSAAVIARPTKSLVLFSQMVGRATRGPKAGGNETCEISTVVDIDLPGFGDVVEAFTNWEDVWHDAN